MKTRGKVSRRGIALISVLIVLGALMAIIGAGLQLGSSGVLQVSQTHRRNVALAAAEAGVYEAMIRLETDKAFTGTVEGALPESGASYKYTVTNSLWTGGQAEVISTGTAGQVQRTLKVALEPDTEGFGGISLGGRVYTYDRAYINGISSAENPLYRPGNAHSEFGSGSDFAYVGGIFSAANGPTELRATGDLSGKGGFDTDTVTPIARGTPTGISKPQYRLDKNAMLSGSFNSSVMPANGHLTGNVRLSGGDKTFPMKVTIDKGATLHIQGGDAKFLKGIEGEGSLVVDGDLVIQTTGKFNSANDEGLKVLSDGSIAVSHPEAETSSSGIEYEIDAVGDFFAQMPPEAPTQIAQSIPVNAPQDGEFFLWLDTKLSGSADSEFNIWYNGDGTELNPGLSDSTKQWLEQSRSIKGDIKAWADSAHD